MRFGIMYSSGDVVLVKFQFVDTYEIKKRPALILFEEYDNYVMAGITSNLNMNGIILDVKEGVVKNSVIKLNYVFTAAGFMIDKKLFSLSKLRKKEVHNEYLKKMNKLLV
jgi:mRNA interferase MazF